MKSNKNVDITNDWKVITVMIGNTDLCDFCLNMNMYSEEQFLSYLQRALDYLQSENNLYNLVASGRYNSRNDFTVVLQPFLSDLQIPVFQDGRLDVSFFSPDCFYPNQKFHTQLARALWSNMVQPLGRKSESLNVGYPISLACPEDYEGNPFLTTVHQGNYQYSRLVDQNWGSDFICMSMKPSKEIPTSVHNLRPADIKVVAAMGDWITTALGARPDNGRKIVSWNGLSWSIGGDKTLNKQTTLPNILHNFNPQILGASAGTWRVLTGLNVAQEQARAQHLPAQAKNLIKQMESNSDPQIIKNFIQHMTETLDILFKELPRVFINLVEIMQVIPMYQNQGGKCANSTALQTQCPCFTDFKENSEKPELATLNKDLQNAIFNFSIMAQYRKRKDFVVITQPFFRDSVFPRNQKGEIDATLFAEDCFHFSARGHDEMAIALWNNMIEPMGSKSTSHDFKRDRKKLKCPTFEHPYLFTWENSDFKRKGHVITIAGILFFLPLVLFVAVKVARCIVRKKLARRVHDANVQVGERATANPEEREGQAEGPDADADAEAEAAPTAEEETEAAPKTEAEQGAVAEAAIVAEA